MIIINCTINIKRYPLRPVRWAGLVLKWRRITGDITVFSAHAEAWATRIITTVVPVCA